MIVLKETKSQTSLDWDRRIVIVDGELISQYRVEDRWYKIPCDLSAQPYKLLSEAVVEQHAEIQRIKLIAQETANLGEQLVQKIEDRQSAEFIIKAVDAFEAAVPLTLEKSESYFLRSGYMNGIKDALKDLVNGQ